MAADMVLWENLDRTLGRAEVTSLFPLRRELQRLQNIVKRSQGAIAALEDRNHIQRVWLENLSTSLHEADDLIDEIVTIDQRTRLCRSREERENQSYLVRHLVHAMSRSTHEVRLFLSLPSSSSNQLPSPKVTAGRAGKISYCIENLVARLQSEVLDNNSLPTQNVLQTIEWDRPKERGVIGRKNDKEEIVKMLLLQPPEGSTNNVSIICMSGVPGVGKSALANDIYKDDKVKGYFDLRMWIPVSNITDDTEIIRKIVESCTYRRSNYSDNLQSTNHPTSRAYHNDSSSFRDLLGCQSSSVSISTSSANSSAHQSENDMYDMYKRRLRKEIRGKLYLLILDNVCLTKWERLRDLLAGGAKGSQILVTTRLADVADLIKSKTTEVKSYPLKGLSKAHSWTLFGTLASKTDKSLDAKMKNTGYEIADICKHLPLTIKIAARFFQGKSQDTWLTWKEKMKSTSNSDIDVTNHILRLCCSDLPTRLRACFEYCSLFPDDFTFNKHDLISLWIAQGFVYPQDDQSPEKTGEMYFMELSRRCLFEEVGRDELGNILTCKMHQIVSSLAPNYTRGAPNIPATDSSMIQIPDQTSKHISINCRGSSFLKFSSPLLKGLRLRTLIFIKEPGCGVKVDTLVCNQLISSSRRLRVLDLSDLGLTELPDSIGEQIHLRYLDLSKNDGLVTLPKSFNRLYNLQTLKLNSCPKLEKLSGDFGLLVNLNRFEVDGCDSLMCMPLGMENLVKLETLTRFVVGKGLKVLSKLTMLRGRLTIEFKGDWLTNQLEENHVESTGEWMKNTSELSEVKIMWPQRTLNNEDPPNKEDLVQEAILEKLQPNSNLKILCIEGYRGPNFPSWADRETISTSLPNLVIISIEGCGKCDVLPPFGELKNLKKLTLRHMTNVLYVENSVGGAEVSVQNNPLFIALEELTLHNFYKLERWRKEVTMIKKAENRSFPSLTKLRIWNCPKLISLPSFPKVIDLGLRNVNRLLLDDCARRVSRLNKLQVKGCPNLEGFKVVSKGLGGLPSLKHLVIERCDALSSLASDLKNLTSLVKLKICSCKDLDISHDPPSAYSILQSSPWKKLKFLRELTLVEIPKMKTLPEGLKHVKTLKMLWISACQSLESLPDWINSLSALQHIRIESCHALKRLPQELENVKSLMKVEITECPELVERCREHTGEDWQYIKHARVLLHKSWRYGYVP